MMMMMMMMGWRSWAGDFRSLYQIWCKNVDRRRNYYQKSKFKMAAVRHLGIVSLSYRTTHEVFSLGHIGLSNFVLIRCIVLKISRFDCFADLAWNAYSRPKNFGFCGSEPLNMIGHHRDPQKAHPWPEPRLHGDFGEDRSSGATWAQDEGIKKKERIRQGKKLTVANRMFAQTNHVDAAIWGFACQVVFQK